MSISNEIGFQKLHGSSENHDNSEKQTKDGNTQRKYLT